MAEDPFKSIREMVAVTEDRLTREIARFDQVRERLFLEMARRPGSEVGYRFALANEYEMIPRLQEELAHWRSKLPPFAEARDGYIMLHPVTPENAHLLREPPTEPE